MKVSRYKVSGRNRLDHVPVFTVYKTLYGAQMFAEMHLDDAKIIDLRTQQEMPLQ